MAADYEELMRVADRILDATESDHYDRDGAQERVAGVLDEWLEHMHDAAGWTQAEDWHAGYNQGMRNQKLTAWHGLFRRLHWLPEPAYYWLLDRLTDNNGWRPLFYRGRDQ